MNDSEEKFEIEVGTLQEADFRGAEAVVVGKEDDRAVALVFDDGKEALELVLREEGDGWGGGTRHRLHILFYFEVIGESRASNEHKLCVL